jgi:hypothetical protein
LTFDLGLHMYTNLLLIKCLWLFRYKFSVNWPNSVNWLIFGESTFSINRLFRWIDFFGKSTFSVNRLFRWIDFFGESTVRTIKGIFPYLKADMFHVPFPFHFDYDVITWLWRHPWLNPETGSQNRKLEMKPDQILETD